MSVTRMSVMLISLSAFCACSHSSLTQIKVSIEQDASAPITLDRVELVIRSEDGDELQSASADLSQKPLPRTVTLVQDDRSLARVRLTATGFRDKAVIVEQKAQANFVRGKLIELHILLNAHCQGVWQTCSAAETCVAGRCQGITAASTSGPSSAPPVVAPPDDALAPPMMAPDASRPICEISHPVDQQDVFLRDDLKLEGHCYDAAHKPLEANLSWSSDVEGPIGTRASQVIKTDDLHEGVHRIWLCALVDGMQYCSLPVSVTVVIKPAPPSATIKSVRQEGQPDGGPFSADKPIEFEGEGSTTLGEVHLRWIDNLVGDFGSGGSARMKMPLVGRHQVTLIATDKANQTPMPPTTVTFDVIEADRLSAGQTQLAQPFTRINSDWANAGSTAVTSIAGDDSGVVFVATEMQVFAFQGDPGSASANPAIGGDNGNDPMTIAGVRAILVDTRGDNGHVFLGTDHGITVCTYARGKIPLDPGSCNAYQDDSIGDVATQAVRALAYLDLGTKRFVAVGTSGGMWVARDANGRARDAVRVSADDSVVGIAASGNAFWFATQSAGVYKYDPSALGIPELYSTDGPIPPFSTLCADSDGGVWLGTRDHGVSRFDSAASGLWRAPWVRGAPFDGLTSNRVTALAVGSFQNGDVTQAILWVGTDQGLTRLDFHGSAFTPLDSAAGLPSNEIRALWVLQPGGALLIGTSGGLALYSGS